MHTFDGSIVSLFLAPSILLALKPRNPLASIFMKLHYRKQYLQYLKEHATSNRTLLTTIKTFTFYDALVMISKAYRALTRQILQDSWTNSNVLFDASTHQYTEPELSLNDLKFKYPRINNLIDEITMSLETLDSAMIIDDTDIEQWNNDDIVVNTYTNDDSMDKISSPPQHFHQNNKQPIKIEYTDDDGNIETHEFDELNDDNNSSDDNKSVIYDGPMNTIVNEISDDNDENDDGGDDDEDENMDFNGNVDENTDMHENDDENMDLNTDMHENADKKMDFNDNVAESINMHNNDTNNDGHNTKDWLINDKQSMNKSIHEISNDKNDKNMDLNGNVAENTDIQNNNINNDEYIPEDFELYINTLIDKDFSPKPPITPIANITENLDNIHSNELIADENACDAPINLKPTFNIIENLQIYNNTTNQLMNDTLTTTTATTATTNIDEPLDLSIKKNDTIYYTCARVDIIETPSVASISNNIINEPTNIYKRKHTRKNNKPYKLNLKKLNSIDDDDNNGAADDDDDDDDDEEDTNDEATLNHNVVTTTLDKEHDTNLFANINKQIDSTSITNMINTNDEYSRSYKKIVDYFNTLSEYETIPIEDEYNLTISSVGYLAHWCNKNNHIQYKFNLFDLINDIILHYKSRINK